ncbi:cytochrome C oxidase subunit IV family protein [Calditrichota bacterium GD2]
MSQNQKDHILPLKVYLLSGAALLLLTVVTVAISFVHLGPFNLAVAMLIASFKASIVALIFMHLAYDNKLFLSIFLVSIAFVTVFIVLTMFDTLRRGDLYQESAKPIQEQSIIYQKEQTPEAPKAPVEANSKVN